MKKIHLILLLFAFTSCSKQEIRKSISVNPKNGLASEINGTPYLIFYDTNTGRQAVVTTLEDTTYIYGNQFSEAVNAIDQTRPDSLYTWNTTLTTYGYILQGKYLNEIVPKRK